MKTRTLLTLTVLLSATAFPVSAFAEDTIGDTLKLELSDSDSSNLLQENPNDSDENIASGTFNASRWHITSDGILHISSASDNTSSGMWTSIGYVSPWIEYSDSITGIIFECPIYCYVYDLDNVFLGLNNVKSIENLNNLSISTVVNMKNTFAGMTSLETLDLTGLDTSAITSMEGMLSNTPIKELRLSENTKLLPDAELTSPTTTGNWVNVGSGSSENPEASWIGNTEALYQRSQEGIADTYIWEKEPVVEQKGLVVVSYTDENGEKISNDIVLVGNIGEEYDAEHINIEGYHYKSTNGVEHGRFTEIEQTVIEIYSKDVEEADEENNNSETPINEENNSNSDTSNNDITTSETENNPSATSPETVLTDSTLNTNDGNSKASNIQSLNNNTNSEKESGILPQTGEKTTLIPTIVGLMIILSSLLTTYILKTKKVK